MDKTKVLNAIDNFRKTIVSAFADDDPTEVAEQNDGNAKAYPLKENPDVSVIVSESGEVAFSDGREIVDGEYPLDGGIICVITDGKAEVNEVEVKEGEKPEESPLDASCQEDEKKKFEEQIGNYQSQITERDAKIEELSKSVDDLQQQAETFASAKAELEKTIADLQKENDELKSRIPSKVGEFNLQEENHAPTESKKADWSFYSK